MIKAGQPVFFGCDVGKFSDSTSGIMDTALFEYEVSNLTGIILIHYRVLNKTH
jgi:aminopeptidase C